MIHFAREALRKNIGQDLKKYTHRDLRGSGRTIHRTPAAGRGCAMPPSMFSPPVTDRRRASRRASARRRHHHDGRDALGVLRMVPGQERETALEAFYRAMQPLSSTNGLPCRRRSRRGTLDRVKTLMNHKAFSFNNLNRVRSLVGLLRRQKTQFNAEDGSGYDFIAKIVLDLDAKNPQVAARLLGPELADDGTKTAIRQGGAAPRRRRGRLSPDVKDIAERSLATIAATSLRIHYDRGALTAVDEYITRCLYRPTRC
jgi:aminopeptidase N